MLWAEKGEACCATPYPKNPRRKLIKRRSYTTQRLDRRSASGAAEGSMRTVRGVWWFSRRGRCLGREGGSAGEGVTQSDFVSVSRSGGYFVIMRVCRRCRK